MKRYFSDKGKLLKGPIPCHIPGTSCPKDRKNFVPFILSELFRITDKPQSKWKKLCSVEQEGRILYISFSKHKTSL